MSDTLSIFFGVVIGYKLVETSFRLEEVYLRLNRLERSSDDESDSGYDTVH